jgi:ABC-type branched-subunit amino acid transport system ATPase component
VAHVELAAVSKQYGGLRPLRIEQLTVAAGERVALVGLDQIAAEVLVNLVTGATLPESGRVALFGRSSAEIVDSTDWLGVVDRFGIVSMRAVLLEQLTPLQNLAIPFTLNVEPLDDETTARAEGLAREVNLTAGSWNRPAADLEPVDMMRIRLGRALALDPEVLLLEHVSAGLPAAAAAALAHDVAGAAARRGAAVIAITADEAFARGVATRVLHWQPATGRLAERRGWFGGRLG